MVAERVRGTVATLSVSCTKDDKRTAGACAEIAELREEAAVAKESASPDDIGVWPADDGELVVSLRDGGAVAAN